MSDKFVLRTGVRVSSSASRPPKELNFSFELDFVFDSLTYPYGVHVRLEEDWDLPCVMLIRLSRCCSLPLASEWDKEYPYCPRCSRSLPQKDKTTHLMLRHPKHPVGVRRRPRRGAKGPLEERMQILEKWFRLENENPLSSTIVIQSIAFDTKAMVDRFLSEAGDFSVLTAGMKKKFIVYPGETRKLTLEAYLNEKLQTVLDGENASVV